MKITLDFSGLKEQLKALEEVASEKEMKAANKRVVERSTPIVKQDIDPLRRFLQYKPKSQYR